MNIGEVLDGMGSADCQLSDAEYERADQVRHTITLMRDYFTKFSLALSSVAVVVNIVVLVLVCYAIWRAHVVKRRFIITANGLLADTLTSLICCCYLAYHFIMQQMTRVVSTVCSWVISLNFWVLAGTYVLMAAYTYTAVKHPLRYKIRLSSQTTALIIVLIWLVSGLFSGVMLLLNAPLVQLDKEAEPAPQWLFAVNTIMCTICFTTVPVMYLLLIRSLNKRITAQNQHAARARWRLLLRVALFNVFSLPILLALMSVLVMYEPLSRAKQSWCQAAKQANLLFYINVLSMVSICLWQLRLLTEPLLIVYKNRALLPGRNNSRKNSSAFVEVKVLPAKPSSTHTHRVTL